MASLLTHLVTDSFRILVSKLNTNLTSLNGFAFVTRPATVTGTFTAWSDDTSSFHASYYAVDGTFAFTIPAANSSDAVAGRTIIIKNRGAGTVTITRTASDTFDGATSIALLTKQAIILVSDTVSDWEIN